MRPLVESPMQFVAAPPLDTDGMHLKGHIRGKDWASSIGAGGAPVPQTEKFAHPQTDLQPVPNIQQVDAARPTRRQRFREMIRGAVADFKTGLTPLTTDNFLPTLEPATTQTTNEVVPQKKRRASKIIAPVVAATLASGLAPGTAAAEPESRTFGFTVSATGPDTYTGLYVKPGQELTFDFDNRKINTNVYDQNSPWVGAEGNPANAQGNTDCRRVDGPTGATILAIVGQDGTFVFTKPIKDGTTVEIEHAGVVDLFVNERPNCVSDNGGSTGGTFTQKFS